MARFPGLIPQPPIPNLGAYPQFPQSSMNALPAHLLALYTQTQGGWRTSKPICAVKATANSLPNFTNVVIQWQSGAQDTDGMFSAVSPTQLTVQTAGWYRIVLQVHFDTNTSGERGCKIMVNGYDAVTNSIATDAKLAGVTTEGTVCSCEAFWHFTENSTIYGNAFQDSGSTLSLVSSYSGSFLAAEWICP